MFGLFRCQRGDDSFETWIAAQWVPPRQQFQFAIADRASRAVDDAKLLTREIVITNPRSESSRAMRHQIPSVRDHDRCSRSLHVSADSRLKLFDERLIVAICRCAIACGPRIRSGVQFGQQRVSQAMVPNGACCDELVDIV